MKSTLRDAKKQEGRTFAQKLLLSLKLILSPEIYEQIAEDWEEQEQEENHTIQTRPA